MDVRLRRSRINLRVPMHGASEIGEARRRASRLARENGFAEARVAKLALVASELATNVVRHTRGGDLLFQALESSEAAMIEILAVDSGPGMAEPARCMQDGYSTRGTSGTGLGAVRRQSDEFDLYSDPDRGTVVMSRIASHALSQHSEAGVRFGAIAVPHPKETVSGDCWQLYPLPNRQWLLSVVDGLGHGIGAADAADAVDRALTAPIESPESFLRAADEALKGTRGAAVGCALLDLTQRSVRFAGVGNIAGCVVFGESARGLMSQHGTLGLGARTGMPGVGTRRIQEVLQPFPPGAFLVMHSDGLQTRWDLRKYAGLGSAHPALIAGVLWRDFDRRNDDATVVVIGAEPSSY